MARIHGRSGRFYMNLASGGTPEPVAFLSAWSINFTTDKVDVTAFGDNNKVYVAGLADAAGDFSGFYDDATTQVYTAAVDGVGRKFYLYPSTGDNTKYWYGSMLPDFKVNGDVGNAVAISSSWNAAGPVLKSTP